VEIADVEVLRAPTLWCGGSDHHLPFGGTLSLTTSTLRAVLMDLIRSAVGAGATRILLLNSHGGNDATCRVAAAEAARTHGVVVASASYWQLAAAPADVKAPGHAGCFETSIVAAVDESLVRRSLARSSPGAAEDRPEGLAVERPDDWKRIDGFTDDPRAGSPELGRTLLTHYAAAVAAVLEFLATDRQED
jgi:creatinine amidohydrolase